MKGRADQNRWIKCPDMTFEDQDLKEILIKDRTEVNTKNSRADADNLEQSMKFAITVDAETQNNR